jgi:hypothetical protein
MKRLLDSQDVTNVPARTRYAREVEASQIKAREQLVTGVIVIASLFVVSGAIWLWAVTQ